MYGIRFIASSILLLSALGAQAQVLYVDGSFQGENPSGESWLSAFPSIQQAIEKASAGHQIWVKAGVYTPAGENRTSSFQLKPGLELYGGFRGNETQLEQRNPKANRTILSGDIGIIGNRSDNTFHVVKGAAGSRIDGFIVTGGNADQDNIQGMGGALLLNDKATSFTAASCVFEKNSAGSGGAVHALADGLMLTNCTFYSNGANDGGAVAITAKAIIHSSVFTSNHSKKTGGAVVMNRGADCEILACSFLYNSTEGTGGAIAVEAGQNGSVRLKLADSTFTANTANENGGALSNRGNTKPSIATCRFLKNQSTNGAGAIANMEGATLDLNGCSFDRNSGVKNMEDIGNDKASLVAAAPPRIQTHDPEPEETPKAKRTFKDVYVHTSSDIQLKLRSIMEERAFTVLAMGDLTDPDFITSYRAIEATAQDYASKDVGFYYIYRYLAHPGNNGYIEPFNARERARHTADAAQLLHTRIPWLYDTMDNLAARRIQYGNNALFIFNRDGLEEYAGAITNEAAFRSALKELAGKPAGNTPLQSIATADIPALNMLPPRVAKPLNPRTWKEKFLPLQINPVDSRSPFYVKMRVEASEELLKTGNGKLYIRFQLDRLYKMQWNNLRDTVAYAIKVPPGSAISPSINAAEKVMTQATDTDPREFLLEARNWNLSLPISVTVTYSVHSTVSNRMTDVSQQYFIYLEHDRCGGEMLGRQTGPLKK